MTTSCQQPYHQISVLNPLNFFFTVENKPLDTTTQLDDHVTLRWTKGPQRVQPTGGFSYLSPLLLPFSFVYPIYHPRSTVALPLRSLDKPPLRSG